MFISKREWKEIKGDITYLSSRVSRLESLQTDREKEVVKLENKFKALDEDLTTAEFRLNMILQKFDALLKYFNLEVFPQNHSPFIVQKKEDK